MKNAAVFRLLQHILANQELRLLPSFPSWSQLLFHRHHGNRIKQVQVTRSSHCLVQTAPLEAAYAAQQVRGGSAASQIPCCENSHLASLPSHFKGGTKLKIVGRGLVHRGHE